MRSSIRVPRPLVAVIAAGVLLAPPALAGRKPNHIDSKWIHPEFAGAGVRTVAILPATTFDGNHGAANSVTAAWSAVFPDTAYRWIPDDQAMRTLDAAGQLGVLDGASGEIRRTGAVSGGTARQLCRALQAQALLCLRVDKWEEMLGADSRRTASVEIHCALVDSAGTELWRISGRSMDQGERVTGPSIEVGSSSRPPGVPGGGATGVGRQPTGGQSSGSGSSGSGSGSSGSSGGSGGSSSGSSGAAASTPSSASFSDVGRSVSPAPSSVREESPRAGGSGYPAALKSLFADWAPLLPPPAAPAKR